MLELQRGAAAVTVDPDAGGRVAQVRVDGVDLLVGRPDDGDPMQWGCFPMVPWAGRLRDGELRFDGRTYRFPLTMPPHAIHGIGYDRPWSVTSADDHDVELRLELSEPWPFGGHVVHRVDLGEQTVDLTLEVHAERPMPAAAGWHPWFRRRPVAGSDVELELHAHAMYQRDADGIPTGRLVPVPPGPWDDCFTGVDRHPIVRWPGVGQIELTSTCDHWVVYDEPSHAVCVEPQTGPPDGLNRAPVVVTADAPLVARAALRWTSG